MERDCAVCGKQFVLPTKCGAQKYCSPDCAATRRKKQQAEWYVANQDVAKANNRRRYQERKAARESPQATNAPASPPVPEPAPTPKMGAI